MEIHSSSLASIPAEYKIKKTGNESALRNQKSRDPLYLNPSQLSTQNTEAIIPGEVELQQFSSSLGLQKQKPGKNSTDRAVNAYIQENRQHLKKQQAVHISSINITV